MNKQAQAQHIIEEFRESKQKLRERIAEHEAQEMRLFHTMLNKLNHLEDTHRTLTYRQRDECARALE